MLLAAYFDESESQGAPPNVMTVAGYLIKDTQAKRMTREIGKGHERFGIPYFHQSECAQGNGVYAHLSKPQCVEAQDYLRAIIKRRTIMGVGANINIDDYERIVGVGPDTPTPYAYAMIGAMNAIRNWIDRTGFDGEIAYFFEDGYKDERNGKRFIDYLMYGRGLEPYRLVSHAHVNKRSYFPLQAADMLAWYTNQEFTRHKSGRTERRKDFAALLRPQDRRMDHTPESLADFRRIVDEYGSAALLGG